MFIDNNSDDDSDFELDAIIHSGYLEEDGVFGDLLITIGDHHNIYRQSTL